MELLILFGILALLIFGPRRGGRMPTPLAMLAGAILLLWLLMGFGLGALWHALVGTNR